MSRVKAATASFYRVEVRLTLIIPPEGAPDPGSGKPIFAEIDGAEFMRVPLRTVSITERLNDLPSASVVVAVGEPFNVSSSTATTSKQHIAAIVAAAEAQRVVYIGLEQYTYNINTDKEIKSEEECIFAGFIVTPTRQFMRGDAGVQLQLHHFFSVLVHSSIMASFAIGISENSAAQAGIYAQNLGGASGQTTSAPDLVLRRLGLQTTTPILMRDSDVMKHGPLAILQAFSEKTLTQFLNNRWTKCEQAINQPSTRVKNVLANMVFSDVKLDQSRYSAPERNIIALGMYNMFSKRTIDEFAGGNFWGKLLEYAALLDSVIYVRTGRSISNPSIVLNITPLNLCTPESHTVAIGHARDVRWSSSVNMHTRGVVLQATQVNELGDVMPGLRVFGCYIDSDDHERGTIRYLNPPPWLTHLWMTKPKAEQASNFSLARGGVMGVASQNAGKPTKEEIDKVLKFASNRYSEIVDRYAKWLFINTVYGGRQVVYSTQYRVPSTSTEGGDPARRVVTLNTWVKLPLSEVNSRYTSTMQVEALYGLVVAKTTIFSRDDQSRAVNYALDFVMTEDEYKRYNDRHPVYGATTFTNTSQEELP